MFYANYKKKMLKRDIIIYSTVFIIGSALLGIGIPLLINSHENCERVKCQQVINETSCTLTYNNVMCTCGSHGSPYSSIEDCYIDKSQESPCPNRNYDICADIGMEIGGLLAICFGAIIVLLSIVFAITKKQLNKIDREYSERVEELNRRTRELMGNL